MNPAMEKDRIFLARAQRLAVRVSDAAPSGKTWPVLVCVLGKEQVAIEMACVLEIIPLERCTPLPTAPPEVLGVMNVHGEIQPVLSLKRLLAIPDAGEEKEGTVLLIQAASSVLGLRVDEVVKTDLVEEQSLAVLGQGHGPESSYLRGCTPNGIIFLETKVLLKWSLG